MCTCRRRRTCRPASTRSWSAAGIDDWGGVSPVTPDHVNPEAPWPQIEALAQRTAEMGKVLVQRLPVYPSYAFDAGSLVRAGHRHARAPRDRRRGLGARGRLGAGPHRAAASAVRRCWQSVDPAVGARGGQARLAARGSTRPRSSGCSRARDADYEHVVTAADALRQAVSGETVRYVVNRNINYTNICYYRCKFCAFSKGKTHEALRGTPYDLALDEVVRRREEAWDRGATEVCLQGGIHPDYTGATYVGICRAIKAALPDMHVHAFSPLEVTQGAATLGLSLRDFLAQLKEAGLGTLPGTAAEILDDEVRAIICPDKVNTAQWLEVVRTAHQLGLRTTSTIMYGHVETSGDPGRGICWCCATCRRRPAASPSSCRCRSCTWKRRCTCAARRARARRLREAVLMHAVARLALHPLITNIQTSWVKMGPEGAALCLNAGANDLGGTLMNESISRAAGTQHGQEFPPEAMEALIRSIGRTPQQRDTLYRPAPEERRRASFNAPELAPVVQTPPRRREHA